MFKLVESLIGQNLDYEMPHEERIKYTQLGFTMLAHSEDCISYIYHCVEKILA
jgi:hypothetical protein